MEKYRCKNGHCPRLLFIGSIHEGVVEVACSKCRILNCLKFEKGRLVLHAINQSIRSVHISKNVV